MQSVSHGSRLVQARPVHRPAMVGILDPVRPYQPSEEAREESHLTTTTSCSQPLRYVTAAVRQCGGLKDRSQSTRRMLVAHSGGMLTLGRKGLTRERGAQPVRVAISSTQTQARPNTKRSPHVGGLAAGTPVEQPSPRTVQVSLDSLEGQVNGLRVLICTALSGHSSFRLILLRMVLWSVEKTENKESIEKQPTHISWQRIAPTQTAIERSFFFLSVFRNKWPQSSNDLFGELIDSYTDAQGLEDGFLVELHMPARFQEFPINRMSGISLTILSPLLRLRRPSSMETLAEHSPRS
jgi:hypothetical protein